ncbi:MAG: flagellar motor protein MotB [Verrucomicrobiota bacterium]|jgi:chemotaxis protein MotB
MGAGGGGAWKVAYADFVTGMMAFFMVMWIVAQDEKTKGELASYFRNRMMSTIKQSVGVLPNKTKDSDSDPNKSDLFQNPSSVPLQFLQKLDQKLERALMENPDWKDTKAMKVDRTNEGLLITFFDTPGKSLFQSGSKDLTDFGQLVFETVAWELARYPNIELELNGHTAGESNAGGEDSWDLSSSRANSTRIILQANGVKPGQIKKVSGLASESPLPGRAKDDPGNRRTSIFVRAKTTKPKEGP